MTDIREQLAALSPEQRKEFAQWLRQHQPPARPAGQYIPRRSDPGYAPLSFAQQRMWLLDQLEPGNPLYTMTPTMRLTGPLDLAALEYALNQIVRRHDTLRATFPAQQGQPLQIIAPELTIPLPVSDLRQHALAEREGAAQQLIDAEIQYHFDLARGPLFRAQVLRLDDDDHILIVTMHHIVGDGWSLGVLIKELVALYIAYSTNTPSPLPELPIQYADYAARQRQRLHGAFLDQQLAHWRAHLADVPVLQLPTDYPHPAVQSYRSAALPLSFSPNLSAGLKQLSRRAGTTLFMTVLAAFATLLSRLSDQRDFCIGSLVAGRTQPELEGLIGFFINNLALRVNLRGRPSVEALLRQVRATTLASYDHQDVPFELVLEALNPTRNASHTPLFQVMCVMQNFPRPHEVLPGLVLRPLYTAARRSGFELTLWLWEEQGNLAGELEYNPTLFEPSSIGRIANQLRTLLTQFAAEPGRALGELALLSATERQQLLLDWNATATAYPNEECIHTLFERQAERTPDAIALVFETTNDVPTNDIRCPEGAQMNGAAPSSIVHRPSSAIHLSYVELERRANQLAHHLRGLGAGPGARVGLCLPRSPELVIGVFGTLKAGAAYVPLDPSYPIERIGFMLEDSGAAVVLVATDKRADKETRRQGDKVTDVASNITLSPGHLVTGSQQTVDLGIDWPIIARQPHDAPITAMSAEHPMYAIYTSGSTGRPKGAAVSHRSFANLAQWYVRDAALTVGDQVLLMTSFSFDLTQKNLFAPLLIGAAVHLAPSGHYDARQLCALIARRRVTLLNCTPSALYPLIEQDLPRGYARLASLRAVYLGGEPIATARLSSWQRAERCHAVVVNSYGPTECTDVVASYRLGDPERFLEAPVPIGGPIANTQLLVLDAEQQLVGVGMLGELCIAGEGVGLGYLNDAALTAERFVPNPFVTTKDEGRRTNDEGSDSSFVLRPSSRLYRTGDLARWLPNGDLVFVGRKDAQVKLRGFRIELGEIEATLRSHEAVRECAVLLKQGGGDQRLVAYIVEGSGVRRQGSEDPASKTLTPHPGSLIPELRVFLKARLPEYMVPSAFVELDALPLTPSGKLDRRMLPEPDLAESAAHSYVAPRTEVEELLAQLWSELLGLAQVSVTERFFDLGGHSLLVAQMLFRLRETFQVELPLRALFENPTVAELALTIEEQLLAEIEGLSEEEAQHLTI